MALACSIGLVVVGREMFRATSGTAADQTETAPKADLQAPAKPERESAERPPIVGVLVKVGEGRYMDDPKNDVSQYVDLQSENGQVQRIWSVQVAKELKAADAQPGDTVKAQYLGIEHVTKPVPVKDDKTGEITHCEERSVERGVWRTEVVRQVQQELPLKTEAQASAPEDAKSERSEKQAQEKAWAEAQRRDIHKPRNRL